MKMHSESRKLVCFQSKQINICSNTWPSMIEVTYWYYNGFRNLDFCQCSSAKKYGPFLIKESSLWIIKSVWKCEIWNWNLTLGKISEQWIMTKELHHDYLIKLLRLQFWQKYRKTPRKLPENYTENNSFGFSPKPDRKLNLLKNEREFSAHFVYQ